MVDWYPLESENGSAAGAVKLAVTTKDDWDPVTGVKVVLVQGKALHVGDASQVLAHVSNGEKINKTPLVEADAYPVWTSDNDHGVIISAAHSELAAGVSDESGRTIGSCKLTSAEVWALRDKCTVGPSGRV